MADGPDPTTNMRRVEFRLSEGCIEEIDRIAYDLTEPGPAGSVNRADVLREAVGEFVENYEDGVPLSRGRVTSRGEADS